ncbi:MAG TPA: 23S ribosomal RNA methyltransferase Erm [Ktedonobacterales bacterium]|nr:23S ribosomal RNA methyltransferase Erm [Ktedonobacterales bacterium]
MSHTPLRYSQNFLRDSRLVEHLLAQSTIGHEDVVYEVGPGKGIITDCLARRSRRVVAVELDGVLAERLRRRYAEHPHVTIHSGDFLACALPEGPYKVFANIPFAHTREIVTRLTEATCPPQDAYLVMQREAAETFCGSPRECLYSVLLKPWFTVEVTHHFRRSDFTPVPNVEVVMLRLQKRGPPLIAASERQLFRDFVVYGFATRQPTLEQTLRGVFSRRQLQQVIRTCAIPPDASPSSLVFPQWVELFQCFTRVGGAEARRLISGSERQLRQRQARLHKIHRTSAGRAQPRAAWRRDR